MLALGQVLRNSLSAFGAVRIHDRRIRSFTPAGIAWDQVIQASHPFQGLLDRMMQSGRCTAPDFSQIRNLRIAAS
jgi:hypothetical protein